MDTKSIAENLEKLNLNVSVASKFLDFVGSYENKYEGFFTELKGYREDIINSFDYHKYEKNVLDNLKKIQGIVAKDSLLKKNDKELILEYKKVIKQIVNKNLVFYSLEKAKGIISNYSSEVQRIDNAIKELNNDKKVEGVEKTFKTAELFSQLSQLNLQYKNALSAVNHESDLINKLKSKDIPDLFSSLIDDFNNLYGVVEKLNLADATKDAVKNVTKELSNYYNTSSSIIDLFDANLMDKYDTFVSNAGLVDGFYSLSRNMSYEDIVSEVSLEESVKDSIEDSLKSEEKTNVAAENHNEVSSDVMNDKKLGAELLPGIDLVYNGTKPMYGTDNTEKLSQGVVYTIDRVEKDENGLDKVYLENIDVPFEPTLFESLSKATTARVVDIQPAKYDNNNFDCYAIALGGLLLKDKIKSNIKSAIVHVGEKIVESPLIKKTSNGLKTFSESIKKFRQKYANYYDDEEEITENIDSTFDQEQFEKDYDKIKQEIDKEKQRKNRDDFSAELEDIKKLINYKDKEQNFDDELENIKKLIDYKDREQIFDDELSEIKGLVGLEDKKTTGRKM